MAKRLQAQGLCPVCGESRLFEKEGVSHLAHGLVTLFLCGLWIPVWIIAAAINGSRPFRCTQCGSPMPLAGQVRSGISAAVGLPGLLIILLGAFCLLSPGLRRLSPPRIAAPKADQVELPSVAATPAPVSRPIPPPSIPTHEEQAAARKEQQDAASLALHRTLAAEGDRFGLREMGRRYLEGKRVEKDLGKAMELLSQAAHGGDEDAKALLKEIGSGAWSK